VADPQGNGLRNHAASRPAGVQPTGKNPLPIACTAAKLFFPQSKSLGIDLGGCSPGLLRKIVYAGSNTPSFGCAAQNLLVLAEAAIGVKQVERLTEQIGKERQQERDGGVAAWLNRSLTQREDPPPDVTPPQVAVVEMDGGRLQIRRADDKPDNVGAAAQAAAAAVEGESPATAPRPANDPAGPEAPPTEPPSETARQGKSKHWREDKVGCLLQMSSTVSDVDPCPEIPAVFLDPLQSLSLAQEIGHCSVPQGAPFQRAQPPDEETAAQDEPQPRPGRPEIESRRVLASRQDIHGFGPLLAATACSMGLFSAVRRAFVADGASENWSVYKRYFCRWTAVLDFMHLMSYVYAAAMAGRMFAVGFAVYQRWIRWAWGGQVSQVIEELAARQQELGTPTAEDKEGSPRRVVAETLTYLNNHQDKMRYDEYRKAGLPLMSSHVESTVKQINYRVKGTEKFWCEEGAEALLQLRADYLSDDEPLEDFWQRRQAAATGQRPYRRQSA